MKAILITGFHYNETVSLVDVKETDKSYMVDGLRFAKSSGQNGMLGYISGNRYDGSKKLYPIDSDLAVSKLETKRHTNLCKKLENYFKHPDKVEKADALKIWSILNKE